MKNVIEYCQFCRAELVGDPKEYEEGAGGFYPYHYTIRKIGITSIDRDSITHWKCPDCGEMWGRKKGWI